MTKNKKFLDTVTYFFKNHVFSKILKIFKKNDQKLKILTVMMKIPVRISRHHKPQLSKVKNGDFCTFLIIKFTTTHESSLKKITFFCKKWKKWHFLQKNVIFAKNENQRGKTDFWVYPILSNMTPFDQNCAYSYCFFTKSESPNLTKFS